LGGVLGNDAWLHGHQVGEAAAVERHALDLLCVETFAELGAGGFGSERVGGHFDRLRIVIDCESNGEGRAGFLGAD
jgi:hypothetical protein